MKTRSTYFEIWATEQAQNAFLRWTLGILAILFLIQSAALTFLSLRKPTLFTLTGEKTEIFQAGTPPQELIESEAKRVVQRYLDNRYNWTPETIEKKLSQAYALLSPSVQKQFQTVRMEQIQFATQKKVSEKSYPAEISINLKAKTAHVVLDRIVSIAGLKAVNTLTLEYQFEWGDRTEAYPEGVYILSEKKL